LDEEHELRVKQITTDPSWACGLSSGDAALAFALLNETVRWKLFLDWHISWACERLDLPLPLHLHPRYRDLWNLLRLVTCAEKRVVLKYRETELHAAVGQLFQEKSPEAANDLPAFVDLIRGANLDAEKASLGEQRYLAVKYSHPEWMVKRWLGRLPVDTVVDILETNNKRDPLVIRANEISVSSLIDKLGKEGIRAREANYHSGYVIIDRLNGRSLQDLELFRQGEFQVQGEMPAFVVDILGPKDGDRILDMCCLPGTKTTYIAALLNHGDIDSVDIRLCDSDAFQEMQRNLQRLHLCENPKRQINLISADGRTFDSDVRYDKILLDVPCSGLGILSRHSDSRWHRREGEIASSASVQRELLSNCARLVKPGGKLVYSTCTTEPEENEEQACWFLTEYRDFSLEDLSPYRIPLELLENDRQYYYPRKFAPASKGKIQSGFAASFIRAGT
jgi:16S rRNA (cytosine(967)-C(5))-methyltransferase